MNKITPRMLRDLDATLPRGAECYLCSTVRNALAKYRRRHMPATPGEPAQFMNKEQALSALAQRLGRGLKRFLRKDVRAALSAYRQGELHKAS
ncbi:hypothetical protein Q9L42_002190 [Methylomarinum sp. Ch1-1]|uniref:Uncharacterized protein n=1 Tax=Methylomarinum roseum TaxID=3067653 RepID=A0AAU7NVE1_9GAMM|nr:hypothetical protein [Methylomarinum sp. Ch1-1]MDP4523015.1 hypothetical protein [Methylomarinum sp. Ch1-1]